MPDSSYLGEFVSGYITAALWSSLDDREGHDMEPLDDDFGPLDLSADAVQSMVHDCALFVAQCGADLILYSDAMGPWTGTDSRGYVENEPAESRAGHDFWLTRNGHGVGFWDRGLGDLGDRLTKAADGFGESCLYVSDMGAHAGALEIA